MRPGSTAGADTTLLEIIRRVVPLLDVPVVLIAVLSQLSAATANTVAAESNLAGLTDWMRGARPYLIRGLVLAASVSTFAIVALAPRTFAAYFGLQALMALRTAPAA